MTTRFRFIDLGVFLAMFGWACWTMTGFAQEGAEVTQRGYDRFPAIHGDTLVFTAEGDLWRAGVRGGVAQRLTSHPGEARRAAISPDGKTLAFSATTKE
jgi:tricorn protease